MHGLEGVLLAAGESRRMGFPKPLLRIGEETFVAHTATLMLEVVDRLVIVVGAHREAVRRAIARGSRITVIDNPNPERGQLSSLVCGLRAVGPEAAGALVHLTDHPLVTAATFAAMLEAFDKGAGRIIVARHAGRRGHPVAFRREIFDELMRAPLDEGARVVVDSDPARVQYLEVDDPGVTTDLDTPEELRRAGLPGVPSPDDRVR